MGESVSRVNRETDYHLKINCLELKPSNFQLSNGSITITITMTSTSKS